MTKKQKTLFWQALQYFNDKPYLSFEDIRHDVNLDNDIIIDDANWSEIRQALIASDTFGIFPQ